MQQPADRVENTSLMPASEVARPGWFTQVRIMMWKNYRSKMRDKTTFFWEMFVPVFVLLMMGLLHLLVGSDSKPKESALLETSGNFSRYRFLSRYNVRPLPQLSVLPIVLPHCPSTRRCCIDYTLT